MNLSPLDIRRQQFAKALRGYDPAEVDAFLKQVSDQQEALLDDIRRADERTREAEAKLVHYEKVELALQEALESARETAKRSEASSEEKARLVVEQAELRAERILHDAERERYELRQDIVKLNARQKEAAARLRGFLLAELEVLAQFQGGDSGEFLKSQPSGAAGGTLYPPRSDEPEADAEPPAAPTEPPSPERQEPAAEAEGASDDVETPAEPSAAEDDAPSPLAAEDDAPSPLAAPLDPAAADADGPEAPAEPIEETLVEPRDVASEAAASGPEAEERDEAPHREPGRPLPPRAVTGGWDLRSLVTGEDRSVAASEAERERIRRILDDLD